MWMFKNVLLSMSLVVDYFDEDRNEQCGRNSKQCKIFPYVCSTYIIVERDFSCSILTNGIVFLGDSKNFFTADQNDNSEIIHLRSVLWLAEVSLDRVRLLVLNGFEIGLSGADIICLRGAVWSVYRQIVVVGLV